MTLKTSDDESWAWVTNLSTGRPVEGLELSLALETSYGSAVLARATTGADGVARLPAGQHRWGDELLIYSVEPFAFGGTGWEWEAGVALEDFGQLGAGRNATTRGHLYTDRLIYRPGQTVYFRGIIRDEDDLQYTIPRTREVQIMIYAPARIVRTRSSSK